MQILPLIGFDRIAATIPRATNDPARCEAWIVRNVERLIEALDHNLVFCEQIVLAVEFKDASAAGRRATLPSATADFGQIVTATMQLWRQIWRGQILAYMHVMAEQLSSRRCFQRGLFDQPTEQQQRVAIAKREINARIGRFVVRSAATLPLTELYRDRANNYEVCDIQGKTCF